MKTKKKIKNKSFILGLGATAICKGSLGGIGIISFQDMKTSGKPGEEVPKNGTFGPQTELIFCSLESVARLINDLKSIRCLMRKPAKTKKSATPVKQKPTEDATKDNSVGYSDLEQQAPRSGAV